MKKVFIYVHITHNRYVDEIDDVSMLEEAENVREDTLYQPHANACCIENVEDDPDFGSNNDIVSCAELKGAINIIRKAFMRENPAALLYTYPIMDEICKIIKNREKFKKIDDFFVKK